MRQKCRWLRNNRLSPEGGAVSNDQTGATNQGQEREAGMDRRGFLRRAGLAAAVAGVGAPLLGACSGDDKKETKGKPDKKGTTTTAGKSVTEGTLPKSVPDVLKIGLMMPVSGLGGFLGGIAKRGLAGALGELKGEFMGRKIEIIQIDTPVEKSDTTEKAYNDLAGTDGLIGIFTFGSPGFDSLLPLFQRDGIPIMSGTDLFTLGKLHPDGPANIFQTGIPVTMLVPALVEYAAKDRGYERVAFVHDNILSGNKEAAQVFDKECKRLGIENTGVEVYNFFSNEFGPHIQALRKGKPQAVFFWGLAEGSGTFVKQMDDAGAGYIDLDAALSDEWHPQIIGSPAGTGEKTWAEKAGVSAKAGSITAWHLAGLTSGPFYDLRDWVKKASGEVATGGEEIVADSLWSLLQAVAIAGSTKPAAMVEALQDTKQLDAFSSLPYGFSNRNLRFDENDVVLYTLERETPVKTDPAYVNGKEWTEVLVDGYAGPVLLPRPTLAKNRKKWPKEIEQLLTEGWGTQCAKIPADEVGKSVVMKKTCKIH